MVEKRIGAIFAPCNCQHHWVQHVLIELEGFAADLLPLSQQSDNTPYHQKGTNDPERPADHLLHSIHLLPVSLGVTDMSEVEVLTAIVPHPDVPCQPKDRQTEHKVEELNRKRSGKAIPYFAINTDCLHHQVPDHNKAGQHRDEHCPFAVDEHCHSGQPGTTSHDNHQHHAGDRVVTEGRASQPGER